MEDIPYLKSQQRLLFARASHHHACPWTITVPKGGFLRPVPSDGWQGWSPVSSIPACAVGAGRRSPAGIKWRTVREGRGAAEVRVVQRRPKATLNVCRPHVDGGRSVLLIESKIIAGISVGATLDHMCVSNSPDAVSTR